MVFEEDLSESLKSDTLSDLSADGLPSSSSSFAKRKKDRGSSNVEAGWNGRRAEQSQAGSTTAVAAAGAGAGAGAGADSSFLDRHPSVAVVKTSSPSSSGRALPAPAAVGDGSQTSSTVSRTDSSPLASVTSPTVTGAGPGRGEGGRGGVDDARREGGEDGGRGAGGRREGGGGNEGRGDGGEMVAPAEAVAWGPTVARAGRARPVESTLPLPRAPSGSSTYGMDVQQQVSLVGFGFGLLCALFVDLDGAREGRGCGGIRVRR